MKASRFGWLIDYSQKLTGPEEMMGTDVPVQREGSSYSVMAACQSQELLFLSVELTSSRGISAHGKKLFVQENVYRNTF